MSVEIKQFEKYTPVSSEHTEYIKNLTEYCKCSARRPAFHMIPPCGLMNDPNGLAYYNGQYHVFYQWHPFGPSHGMKHWGHFISEDLITWTDSPEILIPSEEYEKNGCYSGNSIQIGSDLFLYYTANYKSPQGKIPKQALAIMSPDEKIRKYANNPIIDETPEGLTGEIRDPFVFRRNGSFYMFLGGGTTDGIGRLILYKSDNGFAWNYQGCIALSGLDVGRMIECPSIVTIDGKDVLFLSFIGKEPEGDRYHNAFSTVYLIGQLDVENLTFHIEACDELDKGFDFYAPQAFYNKENKPVYFGWFGCGVQELPHMKEDMWIHGLTMPRLMSIRNKRLIQNISEKTAAQYDTVVYTGGQVVLDKNSFHLCIPVCQTNMVVQIGQAEDCFKIRVDNEHGKLTLDRSSLLEQFCQEYGVSRSLSFDPGKLTQLDLYYDNTFGELFINKGEDVMTFRAFPKSLVISIN